MSTVSSALVAGGGSHRRPPGVRIQRPVVHVEPVSRPTRGMVRRVTDTTVNLLLLLGVAGFLVLGIGPHTGAYRTQTMLTGSMAPGIPVGSIIFSTAVPTSQIKVGDVVTIQAPVPDHHVVTHRVVAVDIVHGQTALRTKGDANVSADPWQAKISDSHVWVARTVVPGAGQIIRWLRSPNLHMVTVYGLPVLVVGWLLWGVWRGKNAPSPR